MDIIASGLSAVAQAAADVMEVAKRSTYDPADLFEPMWKIDTKERRASANRILAKHPTYVPVFVASPDVKFKGGASWNKFMLPTDMSLAQFIWILRNKHLHLSADRQHAVALFMFVWSPTSQRFELPCSSERMSDSYNRNRDIDDMMYCVICQEATFG